jgi:hypothetical protein
MPVDKKVDQICQHTEANSSATILHFFPLLPMEFEHETGGTTTAENPQAFTTEWMQPEEKKRVAESAAQVRRRLDDLDAAMMQGG